MDCTPRIKGKPRQLRLTKTVAFCCPTHWFSCVNGSSRFNNGSTLENIQPTKIPQDDSLHSMEGAITIVIGLPVEVQSETMRSSPYYLHKMRVRGEQPTTMIMSSCRIAFRLIEGGCLEGVVWYVYTQTRRHWESCHSTERRHLFGCALTLTPQSLQSFHELHTASEHCYKPGSQNHPKPYFLDSREVYWPTRLLSLSHINVFVHGRVACWLHAAIMLEYGLILQEGKEAGPRVLKDLTDFWLAMVTTTWSNHASGFAPIQRPWNPLEHGGAGGSQRPRFVGGTGRVDSFFQWTICWWTFVTPHGLEHRCQQHWSL